MISLSPDSLLSMRMIVGLGNLTQIYDRRIFLIYAFKYYPVTRLPDREIALPDWYTVTDDPARVLQFCVT